jgi:hypothetical protein
MSDKPENGRGSAFSRLLPQVNRACAGMGLSFTVETASGKREELFVFTDGTAERG